MHFTTETLELYHPDGRLFKSHLELDEEKEAARIEAKREKQNAAREKQNAAREKQNAEREKQEKLILAQKLRELGINPDDLLKK